MLAVRHELQIVQTPVEVNDIPAIRSEPVIQMRKTVARRSAVGRDAVHIGFAGEKFPDLQGVTYGDGVADEQYAGQLQIVSNRTHRSVGLAIGEIRNTGSF